MSIRESFTSLFQGENQKQTSWEVGEVIKITPTEAEMKQMQTDDTPSGETNMKYISPVTVVQQMQKQGQDMEMSYFESGKNSDDEYIINRWSKYDILVNNYTIVGDQIFELKMDMGRIYLARPRHPNLKYNPDTETIELAQLETAPSLLQRLKNKLSSDN